MAFTHGLHKEKRTIRFHILFALAVCPLLAEHVGRGVSPVIIDEAPVRLKRYLLLARPAREGCVQKGCANMCSLGMRPFSTRRAKEIVSLNGQTQFCDFRSRLICKPYHFRHFAVLDTDVANICCYISPTCADRLHLFLVTFNLPARADTVLLFF